MPSSELEDQKEPRLDPVAELPRELRERLANEIESLPEFQSERRWGRGRSVSHRDTERIVNLVQETLREVMSHGGFIHDLPRRQAKIGKLRDRIQLAKEDLAELCEEMGTKLRALQWMGIGGPTHERQPRPSADGAAPAGRDPNPPEEGISQVEQLQTELKNVRAQCRRRCEALLAMIHELALEEENCQRLEDAATRRDPQASRRAKRRPKALKGSPMVFRRRYVEDV